MKRVLTALILAPVVIALVFLGPRWLIALAVAVVAVLAGWEFMGLAERCAARPPRIAVLVAILALFFLHYRATGIYTFEYEELLGTAMSPDQTTQSRKTTSAGPLACSRSMGRASSVNPT